MSAIILPRLHAGLDEAGRGCVIGPMAIAIICSEPKDQKWFAEIGVRDSKLLSPKKREDLAKRIRERCWHKIVIAQPIEIDLAVQNEGQSLNTLEQAIMASLIRDFQNTFAKHRAIILSDAIGRYPENHAKRLQELSIEIPHHTITAKIKADRIDKTVGASSILAKSERERILSELREQSSFDFGSGYTSDKKAINYVKQCSPGDPIVRWSWKLNVD